MFPKQFVVHRSTLRGATSELFTDTTTPKSRVSEAPSSAAALLSSSTNQSSSSAAFLSGSADDDDFEKHVRNLLHRESSQPILRLVCSFFWLQILFLYNCGLSLHRGEIDIFVEIKI